MERRKAEMHTSYNRLKEECESLVRLLNELLNKHSQSLKIIDEMKVDDILKQSEYFLKHSEWQYVTIQKVLGINLDLEAFVASDMHSEKFSSVESLLSRYEPVVPWTLVVSTPHSHLQTQTPHTADTTFSQTLMPTAESTPQILALTAAPSLLPSSDESLSQNLTLAPAQSDESLPQNQTYLLEEPISLTDASDAQVSEPTLQRIETEKLHSSQENVRTNTPSEKCSSSLAIVRTITPNTSGSNSPNSSESSETINDKLTKRKYLCRQQRYLKSIQKPIMPDLSFKPIKNYLSSTDYYSASDSSEKDGLTESDIPYEETYSKCVIKDCAVPTLNDRCLVLSVVNPSEIYITLLIDSVEFENMAVKLERLGNYFNRFNTKGDAHRNIAKYCMAYSTQWENWNRAEVINWNLNATEDNVGVKVQYVDYGDYETVPYFNLRVLPLELCERPRLAIKSHLAFLYPPGSTIDTLLNIWPNKSITTIKDLIGDPNVLFDLTYVDKIGDSYGIDIILNNLTDSDTTIGQELLNANVCVEIVTPDSTVRNSFMKEQLKTAQGLSGITSDMGVHEIMDKFCSNVPHSESLGPEEAVTGYAAQDEARICRYTKNGSCYKGTNCKLDHEPLRTDGLTSDKQTTYTRALAELPNPVVGQDIKIIMTNMVTIDKFYAQIRSYDSKGESLKRLIESMNLPQAKHQPLKMLPATGEIVIAMSWDDKWYRAEVCDVSSRCDTSEVVIKVFLVDFGDILEVEFKDLRKMSEKYLHLPFQAVRFHINNVIPKKGSNRKEAKEYFECRYLFKLFTANVTYLGSNYIEVLVTDRNDEDVGTQLIDEGFAESKIISMVPLQYGRLLVD